MASCKDNIFGCKVILICVWWHFIYINKRSYFFQPTKNITPDSVSQFILCVSRRCVVTDHLACRKSVGIWSQINYFVNDPHILSLECVVYIFWWIYEMEQTDIEHMFCANRMHHSIECDNQTEKRPAERKGDRTARRRKASWCLSLAFSPLGGLFYHHLLVGCVIPVKHIALFISFSVVQMCVLWCLLYAVSLCNARRVYNIDYICIIIYSINSQKTKWIGCVACVLWGCIIFVLFHIVYWAAAKPQTEPNLLSAFFCYSQNDMKLKIKTKQRPKIRSYTNTCRWTIVIACISFEVKKIYRIG